MLENEAKFPYFMWTLQADVKFTVSQKKTYVCVSILSVLLLKCITYWQFIAELSKLCAKCFSALSCMSSIGLYENAVQNEDIELRWYKSNSFFLEQMHTFFLHIEAFDILKGGKTKPLVMSKLAYLIAIPIMGAHVNDEVARALTIQVVCAVVFIIRYCR